jgi:hypothetical protein
MRAAAADSDPAWATLVKFVSTQERDDGFLPSLDTTETLNSKTVDRSELATIA